MRVKKLIFFIAFTIFIKVVAQEKSWSYIDCVEYAYTHNISLQKQALTKKTGEINTDKAKAQWLPSLNFSTTQGMTNYMKDNENSYTGTYGLNASWTVYDGNSRTNKIKAAQLTNKIDEYSIDLVKNNLETQILGKYLNILYTQESIIIAGQALEVSKAQMERSRELMLAGKLSRVDYSQFESQYHKDNYKLIATESDYVSSKIELKQLLQLELKDNFNLDTIYLKEEDVLTALPSIENVYSTAKSWLPEFKSNVIKAEVQDYNIKIAKSGYYPSISLNAGMGTQNRSGNYGSFGSQLYSGLNEQVSLTLSVPILDKKVNKSAVAQSNIEKLNIELDRLQLASDLSKTIETLYTDAKSAQAKYIAGLEQLKSLQLTNNLTQEQFRLGLVNTLDLLTAHNNLLTARQELLQSKYMAILSVKMLQFYNERSITLP